MKTPKILISLLIVSVLVMPALAMAQKTIGSLDQLIERVKAALWTVFGLIAVICFVVAGILFLTAGGDPDKIKSARSAFMWGVAGVVVGIIAFSIVTIIEQLL